MFPKPVRAEREPKGLRQVSAKRAARIAAGEDRAGLKRSRLKAKPPRRLEGEDAGRLEFARHGVCVGKVSFPDHVCVGDLTASHERNPIGELPTGTGRKEDPRKTVRMCWGLHLHEWEAYTGNFAGWSKQDRHDFMAIHYTALNVEWDALPPDQQEWWQQQATVNAKRRAEARRAAS